MRFSALVLIAGAVLAAPATAVSGPGPVHVTIRDHSFVPKTVRVKVGQEIIWLNTDQDPHTVTSGVGDSGDNRWKSSPLIPDGHTFALRLSKAGNYPYFCEPHQFEQSMHGTIIVTQ